MVWTTADGGAGNNAQVKEFGGIGGSVRSGTAGLYSSDTVQHHPIGYRMAFEDGRIFRYGFFHAACNRGTLVSQEDTITKVDETAITSNVDSGGTGAAVAAGANVVYLLDSTLITATNSNDVFAGGVLHVLNSNVGGYTYRIKSNEYTASTSVMRVDLYDGVAAAIDSDAEFSITGNMWNRLTITDAAGTPSMLVSGISMATQAASDYGWVQTWGLATVLADESAGTIAQGTVATVSDAVDGAAQPIGGGAVASSEPNGYETEPIVGYFCGPATDANHVGIYLQIAP